MTKKQYEITLPAASERVWAFVTAANYWRMWIPGIASVDSMSTAEPQPGTTFEVRRAGQHQVEHWIVAEWVVGCEVRFAEYHRDIQLTFNVTPDGSDTVLKVQVEWPTSRGPLGFLTTGMTPGGRWARSLASSFDQLRELFVFNRDIKLLHGMGDE